MLERLGERDRLTLVEIVAGVIRGDQGVAQMIDRISNQGMKILRKVHAEQIVEFAARLWINSGRSPLARTTRAAICGVFLPKYRPEAIRRIEQAIEQSRAAPPKYIDAEYTVR